MSAWFQNERKIDTNIKILINSHLPTLSKFDFIEQNSENISERTRYAQKVVVIFMVYTIWTKKNLFGS